MSHFSNIRLCWGAEVDWRNSLPTQLSHNRGGGGRNTAGLLIAKYHFELYGTRFGLTDLEIIWNDIRHLSGEMIWQLSSGMIWQPSTGMIWQLSGAIVALLLCKILDIYVMLDGAFYCYLYYNIIYEYHLCFNSNGTLETRYTHGFYFYTSVNGVSTIGGGGGRRGVNNQRGSVQR